jgi:hypothetical protein
MALLAHGIDRREPGLLEQRMGDLRFTVDELGAELHRDFEARHAARPAAPADAIARFEDQHGAPGTRQLGRGRQAGGTGADDDDIENRGQSSISGERSCRK